VQLAAGYLSASTGAGAFRAGAAGAGPRASARAGAGTPQQQQERSGRPVYTPGGSQLCAEGTHWVGGADDRGEGGELPRGPEPAALTHLSLRGNHIGVVGARALADTLVGLPGAAAGSQALPLLTSLDLSANKLRDGGVAAVARALAPGITRAAERREKRARLQEAAGHGHGARAEDKVLRPRRPNAATITCLNLAANLVTGPGARALADALFGAPGLIASGDVVEIDEAEDDFQVRDPPLCCGRCTRAWHT
jgi:hypothetical protein